MSLVSIFATAILPIMAIAGVGMVLGWRKAIDPGPLNTVTVYVLVPALVFHSIATTDLAPRTLASVGVGVVAFTVVMTAIAEGVGRGLGETEPVLGTFVLVSVFSNAGNFGIPVSEFAFGPTGRETAVVYIVAQAVVMYTLGVYLAARGQGEDWREGVKTVFAIPLIYAVVAAIAARWLGVLPPADSAAMDTLKLVGDSAIPVMLLVLGIELAAAHYGAALSRVTPAAALKLVVAPVVAVGIAMAIGFQNATVARVFVLLCAAPAAVTTLILTGEFAGEADGDLEASEFASAAVFGTTLVSIPIVTGLIALLESGAVI